MLHSPQSLFPPDNAIRLLNAARCHFGPEFGQIPPVNGEPSRYHPLLLGERPFGVIQSSRSAPYPAFQHPGSALGSNGAFAPPAPAHLQNRGGGLPPSLESYSQTLIKLSHHNSISPGSIPPGAFPQRPGPYLSHRNQRDQPEYSPESKVARPLGTVQGPQSFRSVTQRGSPAKSPNRGSSPVSSGLNSPQNKNCKVINNNNNNNNNNNDPTLTSIEVASPGDKYEDLKSVYTGTPVCNQRGVQGENKKSEFWRPQQSKPDFKNSSNLILDNPYINSIPLNASIFHHIAAAASSQSNQKPFPYPPSMLCPPLFSPHAKPHRLQMPPPPFMGRPHSPPVLTQERDTENTPEKRRKNTHLPDRHFNKGSLIQLASGEVKHVEDLRTEDFVRSSDVCNSLSIDSSKLVHMRQNHDKGTAMLAFSVGQQQQQVTVEAAIEHPFFVYGRGWASGSPDKTHERYGLTCTQLNIGDVCISLVQNKKRNSSISQSPTTPHHFSPTLEKEGGSKRHPLRHESSGPASFFYRSVSDVERRERSGESYEDRSRALGEKRQRFGANDDEHEVIKCCRKLTFEDFNTKQNDSNRASPSRKSYIRTDSIEGGEGSRPARAQQGEGLGRSREDHREGENGRDDEGARERRGPGSPGCEEDQGQTRKRRWSAPSDSCPDD